MSPTPRGWGTPGRRHRQAWRTPLIAIAAAASLLPAGCRAAGTAPARLYADPANPLFTAAALARHSGHSAEAALLQTVAKVPSAFWAAGQPGEMRQVRQITLAAARAGAVPVIVAYNLPNRDACGKYSAAPSTAAAGYHAWISQLAAAISTGDDIVIVEPDAVPDIVRGCLSPAQSAERIALVRYAMRKLGALPHARVYLDAGNPGMFANPSLLARPLRQAGIGYGRGFSANVANFQWTATTVAWSQRLERTLGHRMGAVIDTSRNGRGPYTGPDAPQWCNPPGRALGPRPRLDPGPHGIDAYLWIKDPGASDGPCHGGPSAGQYWPAYAVALVRASHRP